LLLFFEKWVNIMSLLTGLLMKNIEFSLDSYQISQRSGVSLARQRLNEISTHGVVFSAAAPETKYKSTAVDSARQRAAVCLARQRTDRENNACMPYSFTKTEWCSLISPAPRCVRTPRGKLNISLDSA
jgi:hypothetical protein